MEILRLAVLITCHNRRLKTLACLEALMHQQLGLPNVKIQVYLVDDGSTDSTGAAVQAAYPGIKVLLGDGNLFWNGGMRLAFAEAIKSNYDYYLWLNDDTLLYPNALETLLTIGDRLARQGHRRAIIVGATQDPVTGELTYGGMEKTGRWHPLKFRPVQPGEAEKPCLTMNGNCVLISREVVQAVGNLDPAFTHSTGDMDYGLRNQQQAGSVWLAPGYLGTCEYNPLRQGAWENPNLTVWERWEKINQPRGLPLKEWKTFSYRHAGWLWAFYWLLPYTRLMLKSILDPLRRNENPRLS
jgi:GT2 family glycosyltransferase